MLDRDSTQVLSLCHLRNREIVVIIITVFQCKIKKIGVIIIYIQICFL